MGFLKLIWGHEKHPPDPNAVSPDEIRRSLAKYDRILEELNEALRALHGEPDEREQPHAP